jgi:hypothetical protein
MRPGVTRVVSAGSVWFFDERTHEYLRMPRREGPRENPEWGDERAGPLQDLVWHPFDSWEVTHHRLVIRGEGGSLWAPMPQE